MLLTTYKLGESNTEVVGTFLQGKWSDLCDELSSEGHPTIVLSTAERIYMTLERRGGGKKVSGVSVFLGDCCLVEEPSLPGGLIAWGLI